MRTSKYQAEATLGPGMSGWLCAGLLSVGLGVSSCSPSRVVESIGLLSELASTEQSEPVPRRVAHAYAVDGREYLADIYLLEEDAAASIVLVPGVAPEGKDDPRLVEFAMDLARADFLVLVPEIPNLRKLQVTPGDANTIADAVLHLAASRRSPGLAAISYAAGPALIAALREDVAPHLGFVLLIGGYHDLEAVLRFFTTGYYRESPEEPWQHREPNAYGKWVFARSNAARLEDAEDRRLLTAMADRKLSDLDASVEDLAAGLGPAGRAVYDLLTNRDPERVRRLISNLPPALQGDLEALDLSRRDLSRIRADVILIHGRDDPIIPATESRSLAAALPEKKADLFVVSSLSHADLGEIGISDGLSLWQAAYRVLEERDAAAGGRPKPPD